MTSKKIIQFPPWPTERVEVFASECLSFLVKDLFKINLNSIHSQGISKRLPLEKGIKLIEKNRNFRLNLPKGNFTKEDYNFIIGAISCIRSISEEEYQMDYSFRKINKRKIKRELKIKQRREIRRIINDIIKKAEERNKSGDIIRNINRLKKNMYLTTFSLKDFITKMNLLYLRRKNEIYTKIINRERCNLAIEKLDELFTENMGRVQDVIKNLELK